MATRYTQLQSGPLTPSYEWAPQFLATPLGPSAVEATVPGNFASLLGGASVLPVRSGIALDLSGSNSYATLPASNNYNILGALTLVWYGVIKNFSQYNFLLASAASNGASNNPFELRVDTSGTVTLTRASSSYFTQSSTIVVPTGVPVCIVATHGADLSLANAQFFINGVNAGSNAGTSGPVGPATGNTNALILGTRGDLYSYAKTQTFLAAGFPRILTPAQITSISANPWQLFKAPRRVLRVASGGGVALAGASNQVQAAAGALSVNVPMAAASVQVQSAAGTVSVGVPLSGVASAVQSASGGLLVSIPLSGAALQQAAAAGALTLANHLAGSANQSASGVGTLSVVGTLSGNSTQAQAASGTLSIHVSLSGLGLQAAMAAGTLTNLAPGINLSGASFANQSAAGTLSITVPLTGASMQVAGASGSLSVGVPLSGVSVQAQQASGGLSVKVSLSGAALQTALASAALDVTAGVQVHLSGESLQQAVAMGYLQNNAELVPDFKRWCVSALGRSFSVAALGRTFQTQALGRNFQVQ